MYVSQRLVDFCIFFSDSCDILLDKRLPTIIRLPNPFVSLEKLDFLTTRDLKEIHCLFVG